MAKLGKRLWDDDGFALATILPKTDAIDIGSVDRPFRNMYLSGDISFEDAVFTGDMTVGDDILFDVSTTVDHDISLIDATGKLRIWAGTSFGSNSSSYIQLGAGAGGDLYLNAIDDFAVTLSGTVLISAVNTSAVTIGGNTDLIINKDFGALRRPNDTGTLYISGGDGISSGDGALIELAGIADANTGLLRFIGGANAGGHIVSRLSNAGAEVQIHDSTNTTLWSFTHGGQLNPATQETYTPTNVSTDRSFDADTVAIAELADVVGTLIADLQTLGFIA